MTTTARTERRSDNDCRPGVDPLRRTVLRAIGSAALLGGTAGCTTTSRRSTFIEQIPRLELTSLPTACHRLNNLSALVGGPDLYIKRDDVMELAHGGNKTRKLEFALQEALDRGARAVVTQGGLQSNHVRQTCSGAARVGLEAHVVLSNPVPTMEAELKRSGNFLMDQLMGAHIYLADSDRRGRAAELVNRLEAAGKRPYNIPAGASNGIGSLGYVNAAAELIAQWQQMDIYPSHIVTATGSCGTQAGLLMGLRYFGNTSTQVVGISVSGNAEATRARMRTVLNLICDRTGIAKDFIKDNDIIVDDGYVGPGYGRPTAAGIAAIRTVGRSEGIILDPVYTGKAMSALLDNVRSGAWPDARDVVFLHTGGAPAIHPYADYLGG